MDKFVWDDDYSVGISSIDEEHKNFFRITNDIIDLFEKKDAKEAALKGLVQELQQYGAYHLKNEESYFDTLHYPDAPQHITQHDIYRQKINHYIALLKEKEAPVKNVAEEAVGFAVHWLTNHIVVMDKQYGEYFKEHGVW